MATDDDFAKEVTEAFNNDDTPTLEVPAATPTDAPEPPAGAPAGEEPTPPATGEETKKDDKEEDASGDKPTDAPDASKDSPTEEGDKTPETPKTEGAPTEETPRPLTKEDMRSIITEMRTEEQDSGKALETTTQEVLSAYYPEGLSNVLKDTNGNELKTPQDVVEASGGTMTTEEAASWLMNEQFRVDNEVAKIKEDAKRIAETTLSFKQGSEAVLKRYEPLFKEYPHIQKKVWDRYMKQVKADEAKGVILSAPDIVEYYDDFLEPYVQAFEQSQKAPATQATPATPTPAPAAPEPPKPSADDRLDESGDAGATTPLDKNDFAAMVTEELKSPN